MEPVEEDMPSRDLYGYELAELERAGATWDEVVKMRMDTYENFVEMERGAQAFNPVVKTEMTMFGLKKTYKNGDWTLVPPTVRRTGGR